MTQKRIDARGQACPQPVVMTRDAIEHAAENNITVLVDTEIARDNVSRFAGSKGCLVDVEKSSNGEFAIHIHKNGYSSADTGKADEQTSPVQGPVVYLFDADYIGSNRELGKILVNGFLKATLSLNNNNITVVLISNGVRLATKGSYVLDVMHTIAEAGIEILVCGTCLDFFKIRDDLKIGTVSNALEIMEVLTGAGNVVRF